MSKNDESWMVSDDSRVTLLIVASLTDDYRGAIYDQNKFIVQVTDVAEATVAIVMLAQSKLFEQNVKKKSPKIMR
jgi:hypothetical protein